MERVEASKKSDWGVVDVPKSVGYRAATVRRRAKERRTDRWYEDLAPCYLSSVRVERSQCVSSSFEIW